MFQPELIHRINCGHIEHIISIQTVFNKKEKTLVMNCEYGFKFHVVFQSCKINYTVARVLSSKRMTSMLPWDDLWTSLHLDWYSVIILQPNCTKSISLLSQLQCASVGQFQLEILHKYTPNLPQSLLNFARAVSISLFINIKHWSELLWTL